MNEDGGPAFPIPATPPASGQNLQGSYWYSATPGSPGMSIRDYFAATALQGMLCNGFMPSEVSQHGRIPYDYPGAAYEMADAMLKAREPQSHEGEKS